MAQYNSAGHLLSGPRSVMLMQRFEGLRGQRSSEQVLLQQQQADEAEGEGGAVEPRAGMMAADGTLQGKQARAVQLHLDALHCRLSTISHSTWCVGGSGISSPGSHKQGGLMQHTPPGPGTAVCKTPVDMHSVTSSEQWERCLCGASLCSRVRLPHWKSST